MNELKKEQLIDIRTAIFAVINKISEKIVVIGNKDEQLKINSKLTELQEDADKLTFAIFDEVVTDLKEPGNKIRIATDKLNAAVEKFKTVDEFTGILAKLSNIASTIVGAFSTGNLLQLAGLLDQI